MPRGSLAAAPDAARRVKASALREVAGGTTFADPDALVATHAERLRLVAARARRLVVSRGLRMK
jgi:hypothetical protein